MRYVCIHSHFYQPPRENPWLEQIELQDSAYPYHDWNERISEECYAPNMAARILDDQQRITRIVNNYSRISFNFGPTLLSWAAECAPDMYRGLLEADKKSAAHFSGHGSAIAQAYNHSILPLSNTRDKRTQIHWGYADFVHRFHRPPEGMWLPETAVDLESLDLMAEMGLRFAILAPHQAKAVRRMPVAEISGTKKTAENLALSAESWIDVTGSKVDPSRPYCLHLPSGRSISLFFYDGPVSQAVAFEKLLDNGEKFALRLTGAFSENSPGNQLTHIATDGETYGHHHRHGEMALAYALDYIEAKKLARVTNYGEYLELNPPQWEAQIYENTAWSCVHGLERWRSNCGCNSGRSGWNQLWRGPLRDALDWLRDSVNPHFAELGARYLKDPWAARNAYIDVVLNRNPEARDRYGSTHFLRQLTSEEQVTIWKLMELQRHAMLMYTSCGWFFDDLSGIETVQVIEYAGRVVQLAELLFDMPFEEAFLERLAAARSNLPEYGDGAEIYRKYVKPSVIDLEKVAAHYSISSLFAPYSERGEVFSYVVNRLDHQTSEAGRMRMALGRACFTSKITQASQVLTYWAVHFGDHNVAGGVKPLQNEAEYQGLLDQINDSFSRVDIPEVVRLLDKQFGKTYSLRSLFRDEQRRIVDSILSSTISEAESAYLQLYERHAALMRFITRIGTPMPREFTTAIEYAVNSLLKRAFASNDLDGDRIRNLLREAQVNSISIDRTTLEFSLRNTLERLSHQFASDPSNPDRVEALHNALKIVAAVPFTVNLWSAQNVVYALQSGLYARARRRAHRGDAKAAAWIESYAELSKLLSIRLPEKAPTA